MKLLKLKNTLNILSIQESQVIKGGGSKNNGNGNNGNGNGNGNGGIGGTPPPVSQSNEQNVF